MVQNQGFFIAEDNTNCAVDHIVATKSECIVAASYVRKPYGGEKTSDKVPAGCYTIQGFVIFNSIVNPASTSTSSFGGQAGICQTGILTFRACKNILGKI